MDVSAFAFSVLKFKLRILSFTWLYSVRVFQVEDELPGDGEGGVGVHQGQEVMRERLCGNRNVLHSFSFFLGEELRVATVSSSVPAPSP